MQARVIFFGFDRMHLADGLKAYCEQVAPAARQQPGFSGLILLVDRDQGSAMSVSLWDSVEALAATDLSSYYIDQMTRLGRYFATAADREDYEVGVLARGAAPPPAHFARVVRTSFHNTRTDAGIKVYDETLIANAKKQPGFVAAWLLVERVKAKAFSISLWDSEDSVSGGEISPYYIGQILKLVPYVASLPDSEQCEVAYHADTGASLQ